MVSRRHQGYNKYYMESYTLLLFAGEGLGHTASKEVTMEKMR